MTWPTTFGNLSGGNQPLSLIDGMFQQTAQMLEIPCAASGATAISLTPLVNCPVLTGYTEFCAARFRAAANSGAGVTAQVNGLGFLPVYKADGVTQCGLNDLVLGFEYVARFSQALGGGVGGWFLEAPALGSGGGGTGAGIYAPGGRLTPTNGQPVVTSTAVSSNLYYAPYLHPFVPIYNGSTVQMYQFTSGLNDPFGLTLAMGGSANWPATQAFDVFVTLNAGLPVLGTVQWVQPGPSPPPSRSVNLSVFGGMLTNAVSCSMRLSPTVTISVPANQGTFLGSFQTQAGGDGQAVMGFGGVGSGGVGALLLVCNYYNKVLFNTFTIDNGASYTYTINSVRIARNSNGNIISYLQSDSERAANFFYNASVKGAAIIGASMSTGIGVTSGAFNVVQAFQQQTTTGVLSINSSVYQVAATGLTHVYALELGDGANANTFNFISGNILGGMIWL